MFRKIGYNSHISKTINIPYTETKYKCNNFLQLTLSEYKDTQLIRRKNPNKSMSKSSNTSDHEVKSSNSNGDVTCDEYAALSEESVKLKVEPPSPRYYHSTSTDEENYSSKIGKRHRYRSRRCKPYIHSRNTHERVREKHSGCDMIVSSILATNDISAKKCKQFAECGFDIYNLFVGIAEYILGSPRDKDIIIQRQLNRFLRQSVIQNPHETMRAITYLRTKAVRDYVGRSICCKQASHFN